MTPKEFLQLKFEAGKDFEMELTADEFEGLLQEYADLQKPKWIPIKEADQMSSQRVFGTFERKNKTRFVTEVNMRNIKDFAKNVGVKAIAYMLTNIPEPYQK